MSDKPSILFVCLGNICRSPMAEGAMRDAAERAEVDIEIDSCGTAGYHIGEPPDPRAIAYARARGVDISGLRGRQLEPQDFERFDFILAADHSNLANIQTVAPAGYSANVSLILDVVPGREGAAIADPYYGGEENFRDTWEDVSMAAMAIVERLRG
ncbi:MAG: low molecular weight protein-tyrosine-phosphatase [Pseudomonadota bacterium]